MFTVKEVAEEVGCSVQTIYTKINEQLKKELKPFIADVKRGNQTVKMVKAEGLDIIKQSMEQPLNANQSSFKEVEPSVFKESESDLNKSVSDTIEVLREQLKVKDIQLEKKDIQIEKLYEIIESHVRQNENNQVLLREEQKQRLLEEDDPVERDGFINKVKGMFSSDK